MADKPRGRPPLVDGDTSVQVTVKLPSKLYDRTYRVADRERVSIPEVIRRALKRTTQDDEDADE